MLVRNRTPSPDQLLVLQRMAANRNELRCLIGGYWVSGSVETNGVGMPLVPFGKTCADVWCDTATVHDLVASGWIMVSRGNPSTHVLTEVGMETVIRKYRTTELS